GVTVDSLGNPYVLFGNLYGVLKLDLSDAPSLNFANTSVGLASMAQNLTVMNLGNTPLSISQMVAPANFSLGGAGTTAACNPGKQTLAAAASCVLGIQFTPAAGGSTSGSAVLTDNALNAAAATQTIALRGTGAPGAQTISFPNPGTLAYGVAPITLAASATSALPVSYAVISGPAQVSGNRLTINGFGAVVVQATQAGDGISYNAATAVNATIVVNPAMLTVTVNNATRLYAAANPTFSGIVSGLLNGDTVTVAYSTSATAASAVGSYAITATLTGAALGNYTLAITPGTLTVGKAPLAVTVNSATRLYGAVNPSFGGTIGGLLNGDTVTANNMGRVYGVANPSFGDTITGFVNDDQIVVVSGTASLSTTASAGSVVGEYPITFASQKLTAANYSFNYVNATLMVSKAPLAVTVNSAIVLYGQPIPVLGGTLTGEFAGDGITAIYSTNAVAGSAAGIYPMTVSLLDPNGKLSNYNVANTPGTLTVAAPAVLQSPAPGATLGTANVRFTWSPGVGATDYQFFVGTTGKGSSDLYSSWGTTLATATIASIPAAAENVYVRLGSRISGVWSYIDYTYMEAGTPTPAALQSPASGATLGTANVRFTWSPGVGTTDYQFFVGTTGKGSSDLYTSWGTTLTSATVASIPADAQTVSVRLGSRINGVWSYIDYTYVEAGTPTPAALQSPASGATLGTANVRFTWSPGVGPTEYQFFMGTTGKGSSDLYSSWGTTLTTVTVASIPADAQIVSVRLGSRIDGVWSYIDYTYMEAGTPAPAVLLAPSPGTKLGTANVVFTWSPGVGPSDYQLLVGTAGQGSSNLYNSGSTTKTAATVASIPTEAQVVYARLGSEINGVWTYIDTTYTEAGTPTPAMLQTPAPGATLGATLSTAVGTSMVTFTWSAGIGVAQYQFWLGTDGKGSSNLYNSWTTTRTTATVAD
ncbi:MAG: MBG domain-containing protein, partial [Acidimicrobiales bacterium]